MIRIIPPESFKSIPWKNGKGTTSELAISQGGNLSEFDWRLSIASVTEDGEFSDFSGYLRNLILIEGNGIDLQHYQGESEKQIDHLSSLLDFATFDGGCRTLGKLHNGPIKDLNLMTRAGKYDCHVETWVNHETRKLKLSTLNFVFSLSGTTRMTNTDSQIIAEFPMQHLACIDEFEGEMVSIPGEKVVFIGLKLV